MIVELIILSALGAGVVARANQRQARRNIENPQQNQPLGNLPSFSPVPQEHFQTPRAHAIEENKLRGTIDATDTRAATSLVELDDAIRSGDEELGFATAEFGEAATQRFENALEEAKYQLAESYNIRQRIDMQNYSSLSEANQWLEEIIGRSNEATQMLKIERTVFDSLRKQSNNAEQSLVKLKADIHEKKALVESSASLLKKMKEAYASEALQEIEDNVEQAHGRIVFAEEKIQEAQKFIDSGNKTSAVMKIRYAEQALAQTQQLFDSLQRRSQDLQSTAKSLNTTIAEATQEINSAYEIAQKSKNAAEIEANINKVEAVLAGIKSDGEEKRVNPFDASRKLDQARINLAQSISAIRDQESRIKQAEDALEHATLVARSQISATEDFIMARRGAVGADARVKLAEAQKTLDKAGQFTTTDPIQALQLCFQADAMAAEGAEIAKRDVQEFGTGRTAEDQPTTGAILGGMLVDSLLNKNKNSAAKRHWER